MGTEWTIDWEGASGTKYKYWIYKVGTPLQAKGGNYIFTKETKPSYFVPIYIGQTGDLDIRFEQHHKKNCIDLQGATHIHAHLNPNEKNVWRKKQTSAPSGKPRVTVTGNVRDSARIFLRLS